jgi:7-cyano-7-deazaguanine synthase
MSGERAVVMTSGGLDSTVLLYWAIAKRYRACSLFLNYGQHCAGTELSTLRSLLPSEIQLSTLDLAAVFAASSSRLIREVDLWHEDMKAEDLMLPYRNLFLVATGLAFAAAHGATVLLAAFINSNHAREIDATSAFLSGTGGLAGTGSVRLEFPFRDFSKRDVVKIGLSLGVRVAETYSCQVNAAQHCGACPNCVDRISAFRSVSAET